MLDFLNKIIPNVMHSTDRLLDSILATLQMTLWSGVVMFVCGLFLGVVLTVTREGGIMQRKALYQVLDKLINVCRSIPFVIFIAILLPVTKAIMGTKIGVRGVIGAAGGRLRPVFRAAGGIGAGTCRARPDRSGGIDGQKPREHHFHRLSV